MPVVQTMPEPDAPDDVKVRSSPCHQMPVAVSLGRIWSLSEHAYHQPWPSNTKPQGMPISRRHLISFEQ